MAVPEQTPYIEHTGNGVTTSFSLEFQCESKDHLIVLVDEIEPPIATWSLTEGNVVFTTAPAAGKKITVQRNTPFGRTIDYQSFNNSFRPQSVNGDFDRLWLKLQELGVADWLMKLYVDRLHQQQEQKINDLKGYVDDRDDELRAYLMEEIRKQGVALDQLDEYYNYLMQRLAQIAVDKGWEASFVVDASGKTQQEINDYIGADWRNKAGGYGVGDRVRLLSGNIVKSIIAPNTANPNLDMTGWIPANDSAIKVLNPYMFGTGPSAMTALFAAVEDNSVVVIPQGVFEYNTHLNINGKKNFKIFCFGEFYDLCKPIGTTGGSNPVPVGVSITNCDSFQVYDMVIDSAVTTGVNAVLPAEESNRVPHFDVTNCTNYEIIRPKSKGFVGAYIENLSLGAAHNMRSSFFRFANGVNVKVKGGEITTGSGGGEFFNFADCKGLEWEDCYHYQKDSPFTFWSFGKVIGCDDVIINGHKVQSESPGSLVDLSGTNIVYENITADYPAGKLLDITAEWEESSTATNGVKVRNCTGTWDIGVFTSTSSSYPEMDDVEIENIAFKNSVAGRRSRGFFATHIKNTVLRGCTFENIRDVIDTGDSYIAALDFPKNVTLDDCKITSTLALADATVALLPHGNLNIENSDIDLNRVNRLLILDRYAAHKALPNLQSSITKVTFKNTTIKNCIIDINANVEFIDCTLFNVAFTSTGTGALSKAKIVFSGKTTIEFTNTNPVISTGLVFNLSTASSVEFLKGVKIRGAIRNDYGNLLFPFVNQGVNTLLDGVDVGCQRVSATGVVSNLVMVDYQNATSQPFKFVFKDSVLSKANIQLFATYGDVAVSPTTYCNIEVIDSDLRLNYTEFFRNTANNRLKLLFKSNLLAPGQLTYLDETTVTFNAYKRSENIEWI